MQNLKNTQLVEMFQIEELEERLENAWAKLEPCTTEVLDSGSTKDCEEVLSQQ